MNRKHFTCKVSRLLLGAAAIWGQPVLSQPVNNPISEYYNGAEGYPAWTDEIHWDNVYNMGTFDFSACSSCTSDFEKFKYVRDIAYNAGGGVLYYPAGTYTFDLTDNPNDEGIMLKSGVVIRGQKPASDLSAVTNKNIQSMSTNDHGLNSLPTKFVFTTTNLNNQLPGQIPKMWNCIGIKPGSNEKGIGQVNRVGVAWIELQYGYIWMGMGSSGWATTWATSNGYISASAAVEPWKSGRIPDGTHPLDAYMGHKNYQYDTCIMGEKRFVFGVHMRNAHLPDYVVNKGGFPNFVTTDDGFRFVGRLGVYGRHLFVANNVLSKPTACFKFPLYCKTMVGATLNNPYMVAYDYAKQEGIDINKEAMAGFSNGVLVGDSNSSYAQDILVWDNWIYNHSNKAFEVSGNWAVLKGNINRREYYGSGNDVYNLGISPFGINSSNGKCTVTITADDYMSRFMDLGGSNVWIDSNQWGGTGSDWDNSGEGILIQRSGGYENYSWAVTNNQQATYSAIPGSAGYVSPWDATITGLFHGFNNIRGWVGFVNVAPNYGTDIAVLQNTVSGTQGSATVNGGSKNNTANANVMDFLDMQCPSGTTPGKPTVTVTDFAINAGYVLIEWTNVLNEAGYRVERRRAGDSSWTVIAYRPRQETGGTVTFTIGNPSIGQIGTSGGYPASQYWDGVTRNMNPPMWRDYTKMAGNFEYRVVAVGCDNTNDGASSPKSVNVVVTALTYKNVQSSDPVQLSSVTVYPNPASHSVNVSISKNYQSVAIRDVKGLLIKQLVNGNAYPGTITADISGLSKGLYFVEATMGTGTVRKAFIVE